MRIFRYDAARWGAALLVVLLLTDCSSMHKLHKDNPEVRLNLPKNVTEAPGQNAPKKETPKKITFRQQDGTEMVLIPAEIDEQTGEKTLSIAIDEVVISAGSRRNLVERNGKINVDFVVTIPRDFYNKNWRFTINPVIRKGEEELGLDPLVLSGRNFRNRQERDYERYADFESSIVDSADFFTVFGDGEAYDRYMERHREMKTRSAIDEARLNSLSPADAETDRQVGWVTEGRRRRDEGILRGYMKSTDRKVRRYTTYTPDAGNRLDHLNDYFSPRYLHKNEEYQHGGEIYKRVGGQYDDPRDNGREQDMKMLQTVPADKRRRMILAADKARLVDDARRRAWLTGYKHRQIMDLTSELSDSALHANYENRRAALHAGATAEVDTAALRESLLPKGKIGRNERKRADKDRVFADMVRKPLISPARLDTVIVNMDGSVSYLYNETVQADENTSRLLLYLNGRVENYNGRAGYRLVNSDTLIYNVASMTSFIDDETRYKQVIVLRDAEANARFFFNFPQGRTQLVDTMQVNRTQLAEVRRLTHDLMTDPVYIIDSITLRATSSPEGSWAVNSRLAKGRAESLRRILERDFKILYDSLKIDASYSLNANNEVVLAKNDGEQLPDLPKILRSEYVPEDWDLFGKLIREDDEIEHKEQILKLFDEVKDPDRREYMIRLQYPKDYAYMSKHLYPKMRAVDFRFNLHRRGMRQDTVYTTEVDTEYMNAVELLKKRRYEEALKILRPYEDRNTALAYMSLGYDAAAYRILRNEPDAGSTADVQYMLAILASRLGNEEQAVRYFLHSVELQANLKFRGNLDPEISRLIRKYGIFKEDFM